MHQGYLTIWISPKILGWENEWFRFYDTGMSLLFGPTQVYPLELTNRRRLRPYSGRIRMDQRSSHLLRQSESKSDLSSTSSRSRLIPQTMVLCGEARDIDAMREAQPKPVYRQLKIIIEARMTALVKRVREFIPQGEMIRQNTLVRELS
jgi:hypothetical protein